MESVSKEPHRSPNAIQGVLKGGSWGKEAVEAYTRISQIEQPLFSLFTNLLLPEIEIIPHLGRERTPHVALLKRDTNSVT